MKFSSFIALITFTFLFAGCKVAGLNTTESCAIDTSLAVNVRMMGAKGDGKTDDTPAFLAAIQQAQAGGGIVLVPKGKYLISQSLNIEKLTLAGSGAGAWPSDVDLLPSIIPIHRDSPAFILGKGGFLRNIDITYKWKTEPTNGPAAILITGVGAIVRDVRIRFAWDGILADGKNNIGRVDIENVFMHSIRNVGVRITGTWDASRLQRVEIWNTRNLKYKFLPGVGFLLGKNDMLHITDCFVHGMNTGFKITNKIKDCKIEGATWAVMNGCATDFCTKGIWISGPGRHRITVNGGSFWNHEESLIVSAGEKSRVRVSGSELKSNGDAVVRVNSCDNTVITGCTLLRPMKSIIKPAVVLSGGKVVLGSNFIESRGPGVIIEPGLNSATITGNLIESVDEKTAIVDHRGAKSVIVIASNAITTFPKEPVSKKLIPKETNNE